MSDDIVSLFDQLPGETSPRHLPVGGVAYKFVWTDQKYKNDWKADGYRWRNQGAAKKIMQYADIGLKKTFFHVSLVCILCETENSLFGYSARLQGLHACYSSEDGARPSPE